MTNLVVVIPVCQKDIPLSLKWLRWARWLSNQPGTLPYPLVVFASASVTEPSLEQLRAAIQGWRWASLEVNPVYFERPDLGYAAMANNEFRQALEMTARMYPGQPMLWAEPDTTPTRPTWVEEIQAEYYFAGKPFMGDFHANDCAIPHMTGNAVYSPEWKTLAPSLAALPGPKPGQGWDSSCSHETVPQSHHSFRIQQVWMMPPPHFTEKNLSIVHPETALFHRVKDGSLIDVLAARQGCPPIPLNLVAPRQTAVHPKVNGTPIIRTGGMHIMISACRRDTELLAFCLRSIEKYAKGFAGATLLVPSHERNFFRNIPACVTLKTFDEMPGKGFVHHMVMICRGDEVCPEADTILHMDADCMFWQDATPEHFAPGGKCMIVREHYDVCGPRNQNRLLWREAVFRATGYAPDYDTMVRHPNVYPRELYPHVRHLVEEHTRRGFDDYVLSGKNSFPHEFCEFCALGNIGLRDFPERFHAVDYDHEKDSVEFKLPERRHQYVYKPGRDSIVEGWSHASSKYRNDFNKFLRGVLPPFYVK